MIDRTLPYTAMDDPFRLKGNPRFCTQYNNSETGENIGPMLSGTASWLTLAVYEFLGLSGKAGAIPAQPVLRPGQTATGYTLRWADTLLKVQIESDGTRFRAGEGTAYLLDGVPVSGAAPRPMDGGTHHLTIRL